MIQSEQLTSFATIARALVDECPLPERLDHALTALRSSLPFSRARIVVLANPAWSYVFPAGDEHDSEPGWPGDWTADVLRMREPQLRQADGQSHYLAWPLLWQDQICGALEL